jgi:hypothetical protein
MAGYAPRIPPSEYTDLLLFLDEELVRIAQVLNRVESGEYTIHYNEPPRYFPGLVVYADGTSWNPGAGEGLYRRSLLNTWVKVG